MVFTCVAAYLARDLKIPLSFVYICTIQTDGWLVAEDA